MKLIDIESIESIEFNSVGFGYKGEDLLFHDISFRFEPGSVVQAKGPIGHGKSTLLKILAGLLEPTQGKCLINGQNTGEMTFEEFLHYRLHIGYSFDMGGLLSNKSLYDNLHLPLQYHSSIIRWNQEKKVADSLSKFGLSSVAHLRPSAVSGSQRKATCVARSLIMEPELLILDDPMVGLSKPACREFEDQVRQGVRSGEFKMVFFCSSIPSFLDDLVSHEIKLVHEQADVDVKQSSREGVA